eukprot:m.203751 g.203751  ORF g.203751 m.203751 type:complete len:234 (-) comp18859_c0_seq1:1613-2314(-)
MANASHGHSNAGMDEEAALQRAIALSLGAAPRASLAQTSSVDPFGCSRIRSAAEQYASEFERSLETAPTAPLTSDACGTDDHLDQIKTAIERSLKESCASSNAQVSPSSSATVKPHRREREQLPAFGMIHTVDMRTTGANLPPVSASKPPPAVPVPVPGVFKDKTDAERAAIAAAIEASLVESRAAPMQPQQAYPAATRGPSTTRQHGNSAAFQYSELFTIPVFFITPLNQWL